MIPSIEPSCNAKIRNEELVIARGSGGDWQGGEVGVAIEKQVRDLCSDGNVLYSDDINVNITAVICYYSFIRHYYSLCIPCTLHFPPLG